MAQWATRLHSADARVADLQAQQHRDHARLMQLEYAAVQLEALTAENKRATRSEAEAKQQMASKTQRCVELEREVRDLHTLVGRERDGRVANDWQSAIQVSRSACFGLGAEDTLIAVSILR